MQTYLEGSYNKIPNSIRDKLVELVIIEHITIKEAALRLKLKYSTAKTIFKVFKKEQRTHKCTTRSRCPELPKSKIKKLQKAPLPSFIINNPQARQTCGIKDKK